MPTDESRSPYALLLRCQAWILLIAGAICLGIFACLPLHPKNGESDVHAIVCFSIASALGIGLSLAGMRFCKGSAKLAAYVAFALFTLVALNLANSLMGV